MTDTWFRLDGKCALVTGAATGIGAGIAVALARSGADVGVSDLPGEALTDTVDRATRHGRKVIPFAMDVRDGKQREQGVAFLKDQLGGIDAPTAGMVFIDEVDISQLDPFEVAWLRCRKIGYIFQSVNLTP